jgi:hypothetical protein
LRKREKSLKNKREREPKRRRREQTMYLEYLSVLCIVSSAIQEIECPLEVHIPTNTGNRNIYIYILLTMISNKNKRVTL